MVNYKKINEILNSAERGKADVSSIENEIEYLKPFDQIQDGILYIRYLIIKKVDINEIGYFYSQMKQIRKRNMFLIVQYALDLKEWDLVLEFFKANYELFDISGSDINCFLKSEFPYKRELLSLFVNKPMYVDMENNVRDASVLKFIPFSQEEYKLLINLFDDSIDHLIRDGIEYVIDVGNILYSKKGEYSFDSLKNIISTLGLDLKHLLFVMNKSHHKTFLREIPLAPNILITPKGQHDDLYIIKCGIVNNAFIISNDQYRDLIFTSKSELFKYWINDYVVSYRLVSHNLIYFNFKRYSQRIQFIDDKFYVPTIEDGWVAF